VKRAAYTCDHCGASVSLHAKGCPSCGKAFDAVKCPRCGHLGPPQSFTDGCPACHYLATPTLGTPTQRSIFGPTMGVVMVLLGLAVAYAWFLRG